MYQISQEDEDLRKLDWYINKGGYVSRRGGKLPYLMHRIILARVVGRDLIKAEICDHINGIKTDNRRTNLRIVTALGNAQNRNYGHYAGTIWDKRWGKWMARLKYKGKQIYLGLYVDRDEAALAYRKKKKELGLLYRRRGDEITETGL